MPEQRELLKDALHSTADRRLGPLFGLARPRNLDTDLQRCDTRAACSHAMACHDVAAGGWFGDFCRMVQAGWQYVRHGLDRARVDARGHILQRGMMGVGGKTSYASIIPSIVSPCDYAVGRDCASVRCTETCG